MTTARDAAAYKLIYDTRAERLTRATGRAESWIAGLTALVTVLTTAMVVKGPENFAKADGAVRVVVLVLVALGAAGIGLGLVLAYSAAFGGLFRTSATDRLLESPPTTANGAADLLDAAAASDAQASRASMRSALASTVAAMICLVAAVGFSWFSTAAPTSSESTCIDTGTGIVALSGDVRLLSGSPEIVPCPEEAKSDGGE